MPMKHVAIMGLGLMGGSLGLALKRAGSVRVTAFARREETRRLALDCGAVDEVYGAPGEAVRGADLAVFCVPVLSIPALVEQCRDAFATGCVVTDVGSTKAYLADRMDAFSRSAGIPFVGSHPMAGSDRTGMESARVDLYEGAVAAVTPGAGSPSAAVGAVRELWTRVGARVITLSPEQHDRLVARTSHLTHLVASLLVATAGRDVSPELKTLIGPGFRDTTRVAGGDPGMWHDIVRSNTACILEELRAYQEALSREIRLIEAGDFEAVKALLEAAVRLRGELTR